MALRPRIFISAVSKELKSARQLVANTLQFLGYEPDWQDVFSADQGDLRAMLREKIDGCRGVVQIVGQCYGAEPTVLDEQYGRVSYTQYEALYARRQGKKVWYLLLDQNFPSDPYDPEPTELHKLQADYRQHIQAGTRLFHLVDDTHEALENKVLKMRFQLRWLQRGFRLFVAGITAATLVIIALLVWLVVMENSRQVRKGELDPLALHWYGFGQRLQGGEWREFQVQDGATLYTGDQFRLDFIPSADSYVYVLCFNVDGSVTQLFPNPAIRQPGLCRGGQKVQIPDGLNWFTLDNKVGTETLYLIAAYDPLTDLQAIVKKSAGAAPPAGADKAVQGQIALVEKQNRPDDTGTIRTRSGVVVRNVDIRPSRHLARAQLTGGRSVEAAMEFVQGKASAVQRIQFAHKHLDAKAE